MNKKKAGILMCTHFNCDHRRGNYCCFQCQKIGTCKNPCYNSPLKCGLAKEVENLQKWSDEHPKKTYVQDFFEKFPKAQSKSDGTPFVCRKTIYGGECTGKECDECWNEPMEE